jgi:hypothetical protein
VRQRLVELELDLLPDVPVAAEVVAVEGAQGADGLVETAWLRVLALSLRPSWRWMRKSSTRSGGRSGRWLAE